MACDQSVPEPRVLWEVLVQGSGSSSTPAPSALSRRVYLIPEDADLAPGKASFSMLAVHGIRVIEWFGWKGPEDHPITRAGTPSRDPERPRLMGPVGSDPLETLPGGVAQPHCGFLQLHSHGGFFPGYKSWILIAAGF